MTADSFASSTGPENINLPAIIGDIGGTNSRFSLLLTNQTSDEPISNAYLNVDFPNVEAAVAAFVEFCVQKTGEINPVRTIILALACPIVGDEFQMTNSPWLVRPNDIVSATKCEKVLIMNDFVAQGLASIALSTDQLLQMGGNERDMIAPRVIIGPGTGLGVGLAVQVAGKWALIPGEGGHVEIGPRTAREFKIWPFLRTRGNRLEAELVISGQGLENLFQAICKADYLELPEKSAAEISAAATTGLSPQALEAVELMVTLLGRLAGDLALLVMAKGGVYLGGGITRHILSYLEANSFRLEFENKTPFERILKTIPVFSMSTRKQPKQDPALSGMVDLVHNPQKYHFDMAIRTFLATDN